MKNTFLVVMVLFLSGCIVPHSRLYHPPDQQEITFLKRSDLTVFPGDVRQNLAKYSNTHVAWTGILKKADVITSTPKTTVKFIVEHHYWDWVEDYSIQKAVAFLSPRGEGLFSCTKISSVENAPTPPVGSMVIAYGYPVSIDPDDRNIEIKCTWISFASESWYSTEIWDYGRDFILKGDKSDFKVLKVPFK